MNRAFGRVKLVFLGIFAVAVAGILIYQIGWGWPGQKCEENGMWWDNAGRVCAKPVMISDITGRTPQDKQAEAAARAALEAAKTK